MTFLPPDSRFHRAARVVALLLAGMSGAVGQEASGPAPVRLAELPERFFQIQDESGFLWQALDNGALLSGDTQYLQSGLNLIVDGEPFTPTEALLRDPAAGGETVDLRLEEKRSDLSISRDLWFDTRRSGVRVLDFFTNSSKNDLTLAVVLRTTYPFAWQSLHGTGGAVLGSEPALRLRPDDISLGIHFSPSEGRHDTFFLFGSEKGGLKPELKASANSRELIFTYSVVVPAGQRRGLLHWILQRNLPEVSQDAAALAPFTQRGQWIAPGLEVKAQGEIVNLPAQAFLVETPASPRLRDLVALNESSDLLGIVRRAEDLLWLGPSSQVSGLLNREGALVLSAPPLGEVTVNLAEIAAIRGGAGQGSAVKVFLRDGRVHVGAITGGSLGWTANEATAPETLDPATLQWLFLGTSAQDGTPPPTASHFLQLIGGPVLGVTVDPASELEWVAPWGKERRPWSEIAEWVRESAPAPSFRVLMSDGSTHSVVLPSGNLSWTSSEGKTFEVSSALVERLWSVSGPPRLEGDGVEEWIDFTEVPAGLGPATGVLLSGRQLLSGSLTPGTLTLLDGEAMVRVDKSRIESLVRSPESDSPRRYEIRLSGGERVAGDAVDVYLGLDRSGRLVELPFEQVLAFRKATVE